jgi:hypothetical protein
MQPQPIPFGQFWVRLLVDFRIGDFHLGGGLCPRDGRRGLLLLIELYEGLRVRALYCLADLLASRQLRRFIEQLCYLPRFDAL